MTMRQRKRRMMSRATEALFPRNERIRPFRIVDGFRRDPRWERRMLRRVVEASGALVFPPAGQPWGWVVWPPLMEG